MKDENFKIFSSYFRSQLLMTRQELGLTQFKMAEQLEISLRFYADLERGINSCKTETLIQYLTFCSTDPIKFSADLNLLFQKSNLSRIPAYAN